MLYFEAIILHLHHEDLLFGDKVSKDTANAITCNGNMQAFLAQAKVPIAYVIMKNIAMMLVISSIDFDAVRARFERK